MCVAFEGSLRSEIAIRVARSASEVDDIRDRDCILRVLLTCYQVDADQRGRCSALKSLLKDCTFCLHNVIRSIFSHCQLSGALLIGKFCKFQSGQVYRDVVVEWLSHSDKTSLQALTISQSICARLIEPAHFRWRSCWWSRRLNAKGNGMSQFNLDYFSRFDISRHTLKRNGEV